LTRTKERDRVYVQLFKNRNGKWHWHLKAKNGRVLASSEAYSSHARALKTAVAVAAGTVESIRGEDGAVLADLSDQPCVK
jgi:uncharacterized protein YegP (UPF0339 family)